MTPLLPLNPVLNADLLAVESTTRVWAPHGSVAFTEPMDWLRLADGRRRLGELLQAAPDPVSALRALHTLADLRLLTAQPRALPPRIAIIGQGRLAQDLCAALATDPVQLVLAGPARPGAVPGIGASWDLEANPAAVASISHQEHWSQVDAEDCSMAVVAAETCEPDRAILHHLTARGVPHLVVKAHRDTATVGPGWPTGACTNCIDLETRDQDPAWGRVVLALSQREADPDHEISLAATALAVQRLRAGCRSEDGLGSRPASEVVTVVHPGGVDQQYWPPHPECCGRAPRGRRAGGPGRRASGGRTDRLAARQHAAA